MPKVSDRVTASIHEAAHSVVRQLLIGNLRQTGLNKKGAAYSYPYVRKPLSEIDKETLAKLAVVIYAGPIAEERLLDYAPVGNESIRAHALSDDHAQLRACQDFGSFTDEEMRAFENEALRLVEQREMAIRRVAKELNLRSKLSGEQVTQLMNK